MPTIVSLSGQDVTNLVSVGLPAQASATYSRTQHAAWRGANPNAPASAAETVIANTLGSHLSDSLAVHVYDVASGRLAARVSNTGEPLPAQWWIVP